MIPIGHWQIADDGLRRQTKCVNLVRILITVLLANYLEALNNIILLLPRSTTVLLVNYVEALNIIT